MESKMAEHRYRIVNIDRDIVIRRGTLDQAESVLHGMQLDGDRALILDAEALAPAEIKATGGLATLMAADPLLRIDAYVQRFLGWKLPATFSPDCGVHFDYVGMNPESMNTWPVGTNLLTADEARQMLEHILGFPLPDAEQANSGTIWLRKGPHVHEIARICHETNRAFCAAMGDDSQPAWDEAPGWQRESAIAGVQGIIDNPDRTPEQSHAAWSEHKLAEGWVWGPEKDAEAKTHPCLVDSYDELPPEQRAKDYIFGAIVRSMLAQPS